MNTICGYMTKDHERCDQLLVEAENEVVAGRWDTARHAFARLQACFERHFEAEEQVLFPAMEARAVDVAGPTGVMRREHEQIRDGLAGMASAVYQEDQTGYLAAGETLLIMIQQHNLKEEQILYPMGDRLLASNSPELLDRLTSV